MAAFSNKRLELLVAAGVNLYILLAVADHTDIGKCHPIHGRDILCVRHLRWAQATVITLAGEDLNGIHPGYSIATVNQTVL